MKLEVQLVQVYAAYRDAYIGGDVACMPERSRQTETLQQDAQGYLEGKVQELRIHGLERVISIAVEGNAPDEIIDLAQATPDNLISMSTHGRSGVGDWVLGSVTEKVVTSSMDPGLCSGLVKHCRAQARRPRRTEAS